MPNTETVRALVSAFNVNNYDFNAVKTNFTLQSNGKASYIVVSFDGGMDKYQCSRYLDSIKRKIIREFYGIEESNDAEILDTAKLIFDVKSFPFDMSKGELSGDQYHGFKFVTPIDQGVIFNLKSHLASSLKKDVLEDMRVSSTTTAFDKKKYLWCCKFPNKQLREQFEREFLLRMRKRYENVPKNPLKIEGSSVYIKDVFDDARFIDSVTRHAAWLIGRDLQADSKSRSDVRAFKDLIIEFINQSIGLTVVGFMCAPPLDGKGASILIPVILDSKGFRALTKKEALSINSTFDGAVFVDINGKTQAELPVNGGSGVYGIDFSNKEISHCVITTIIQNSVINKDHELSIDPELHFRALSPAQSPVRVPNGPSSGLTELSSPTQEFSTRSHGKELKDSPRQGLLSVVQLNSLDIPGTSKEFSPSPQVNSIAVSYDVSRPSSSVQSVGAMYNVQAGANTWPQQLNYWVPQGNVQLANPWPQSPWPSQGTQLSPPLIPTGPGCSSWQVYPQASSSMVSESSSSGCKISNELPPSNKLNNKEKELIEALLYWFNFNNQIFECHHTNFIVENGKIASLINDGVDVKEYLQKVRDYTIKEYCGTEEEAKEAYDLNEFPFKFLSNCEKNQETTVVANISCGALFNLKKLFIQEHEKKVEIEDIDINIVKKAVKSKKDEWVDSQVKQGMARPHEVITTCYPDESKLKYIPIIKDKGGYCLDRTYENWEVESFLKERRCAKGASKAEKMKSEDNKDSGYSSRFVTDAENVSSKAEATTSSGYESMDCENTRGGSPKRTLELSVGMGELTISTDLYAIKAEQHSPIKKFRSN